MRYQRELRVSDLMHVESGVIGAEPGALLLGHKLIDSGAASALHHRGAAGAGAGRADRARPPGASTAGG